MGFYNPWGLLSLLAIPLIIVMYLLKQKYKEQEISSLYLWQKVLLESKSQEPWQKLRKNLLMFLQILAVVLLGLALGNPYHMGKGEVSDYVLALDCSFSMQGTDVEHSKEKNRFYLAKEEIIDLVKNTPQETTFSLVTLEEEPKLVFSGLNQKQSILNYIEQIEVGYGSINILGAGQILSAEKTVLGEAEIKVFTDQQGMFDTLKVTETMINQQGDNGAITLLSYIEEPESLTILTKVEVWEEVLEEKTVSLYIDGVIFDTVSFVPKNGISEDIIFQGVPKEATSFMVKLSPEDDLMADNMRYIGVSAKEKQSVVLISNGNIFLEKALSLIPNIELYKTGAENNQSLSGYGLYVFDGNLPDSLPTDGHVLVVNPPVGSLPLGNTISIKEDKKIEKEVRIAEEDIFPSLENLGFYVQKGFPLNGYTGRPLLEAGNDILGIYDELEGRKTVVLSFDLLESNFPLMAEFPIFLHNLLQWYFPQSSGQSYDIEGSGSVELSLRPETKEGWVVTPSGEKIEVAPPFPPKIFTQTQDMGIYTLVEKEEQEQERVSNFAVNPVVNGESNLKYIGESTGEIFIEAEKKTIDIGKSMRNASLLLLCLCLVIEWRVSCSEN